MDVEDYYAYVMDADGSPENQIITSTGIDRHPSWSPLGPLFVLYSTRDSRSQIYKADFPVTFQANISNNLYDDIDPEWSPNGNKIVFVSNRDGKS